MTDFTPYSALVGGIIIGLSVVFYFFTTGRLAGISGIFENAITNSVNRFSNLFFLLGLVVGPLLYYNVIAPKVSIAFNITDSYTLIILREIGRASCRERV